MEDRVWCSKRASHVHSEPLYQHQILHETIVCFYLNVFPKFLDIFFCLIYFVKENIMLHGYLIVLHQLSTCNWILEVLLFPRIFTGLTATTHFSVRVMLTIAAMLLIYCWNASFLTVANRGSVFKVNAKLTNNIGFSLCIFKTVLSDFFLFSNLYRRG